MTKKTSGGATPSPIWHPFTQHGLESGIPNIASAKGAWLTTADGKQLFDAISSWWVVTHGHCHPKIIAAIKAVSKGCNPTISALTPAGKPAATAQ